MLDRDGNVQLMLTACALHVVALLCVREPAREAKLLAFCERTAERSELGQTKQNSTTACETEQQQKGRTRLQNLPPEACDRGGCYPQTSLISERFRVITSVNA